MKRRLSSVITPFYKGIPFILGLYGLFWLVYDFRRASFSGIILFFLWCSILYLFTRGLKSVYLDSEALIVSNYLKRIKIPLSSIESVHVSSRWAHWPRTITVLLKAPSGFGESFMFVNGIWGCEPEEIAAQLRNSVASQR
jgi:hypothetical protein